MSGYSPIVSRKACSVVPGLPNTYRTPSAMSCSTKARLPVILATRHLAIFVAARSPRERPSGIAV